VGVIFCGTPPDWSLILSGDGYGYGYGYGNGGDGYGYGYGYGDGGDGDGYGYGYGYGNGGDGDGDWDGYGDGYGDGGDGDGDGAEMQLYWSASISQTTKSPEPNTILAYWRSTIDGRPANGGGGTKAVVGLVEEIDGPLNICTKKALHGTLNPPKWMGEKIWIVALYQPVQVDGDKIASLKRKIISEAGFQL
jgi:hypothetical protein